MFNKQHQKKDCMNDNKEIYKERKEKQRIWDIYYLNSININME